MSGPEPPMKHGKRNRDTSESSEVVTPTSMKHFNSLIKAKHTSVSWVGNYTVAHTTKIEIGFLKREAMALTTLLSYYQEDGQGATACPVALVSGSGGLGRKLAFFFCGEGRSPWYHTRGKIDLSVGHRMFNKPMRVLGQFARADYFLANVEEFLRKGLNKRKNKVVLKMTDGGRLDLSTQHYLSEEAKLLRELSCFFDEMFAAGQIDVVDLLFKHFLIRTDMALMWLHVAINVCNVQLVEVVRRGIDAPAVDATGALHLLRVAVWGSRPKPGNARQLGDIEIVKEILSYGSVPQTRNARWTQQTPVQMAIGGRNAEMLKLLLENYPEAAPCDLHAECADSRALFVQLFPVGDDAEDWLRMIEAL